jgi:hypothetical protein
MVCVDAFEHQLLDYIVPQTGILTGELWALQFGSFTPGEVLLVTPGLEVAWTPGLSDLGVEEKTPESSAGHLTDRTGAHVTDANIIFLLVLVLQCIFSLTDCGATCDRYSAWFCVIISLFVLIVHAEHSVSLERVFMCVPAVMTLLDILPPSSQCHTRLHHSAFTTRI